jgi:glycosyltransferase involved in cell wall biosynthesis
MQQKLSALWIVGWFPTKANPYAGNFIKRHATACSKNIDIHILHAATHSFGKEPVKPILNEHASSNHYQLHLLSIPQFDNKLFKPINLIIYYLMYWRFAKKVVAGIKNIHILHLHVPNKCGFIAVWLKKLLQIPLVLTEHWAIYNTPVPDHFLARNAFFRYHFKYVWKHVDAAAQVSLQLHCEMENLLGSKKPVIYFPNVVSQEFIFNSATLKPEVFTMVHVSNGESRKNIPLIFASALKLSKSGSPVNLKFVGFDGQLAGFFQDVFYSIINSNKNNSVDNPDFYWEILGKKQPLEINELFQNSDCLVMASSSENAPCVISESLCSGLPVISSNVGGISKMIDHHNGFLFNLEIVENADPAYNNSNIDTLYQTMFQMKENVLQFKKEKIAENAIQIYGDENISNVLFQLYLGL